MINLLNRIIDRSSEYLAARKGLLPLIGILLILINGIFQFIPAIAGLAHTNLLLHIGVIVAILGIMVAWAL